MSALTGRLVSPHGSNALVCRGRDEQRIMPTQRMWTRWTSAFAAVSGDKTDGNLQN